jgi:hypothetical protein
VGEDVRAPWRTTVREAVTRRLAAAQAAAAAIEERVDADPDERSIARAEVTALYRVLGTIDASARRR